jgi:hypothetical protein
MTDNRILLVDEIIKSKVASDNLHNAEIAEAEKIMNDCRSQSDVFFQSAQNTLNAAQMSERSREGLGDFRRLYQGQVNVLERCYDEALTKYNKLVERKKTSDISFTNRILSIYRE